MELGERPEEAALRELLEETGYVAKELVPVMVSPLSAELTGTRAMHYFAPDVEFVGTPASSEIEEIEVKIKELEDKRKQLTSQINENLLSTYEKLLKTRNGLAIVPVENENCGACHIKVTAQKINEIKMYKELIFCENCVRILYLKEDFE